MEAIALRSSLFAHFEVRQPEAARVHLSMSSKGECQRETLVVGCDTVLPGSSGSQGKGQSLGRGQSVVCAVYGLVPE